MSDIEKMSDRAAEIAALYEQSNIEAGRKVWEARDYLDGMIGDIGDLTKLLMARDGLRDIDDIETKIDHELDDVQWSLYLLYRKLGRIPGATFMESMNALAARFDGETK